SLTSNHQCQNRQGVGLVLAGAHAHRNTSDGRSPLLTGPKDPRSPLMHTQGKKTCHRRMITTTFGVGLVGVLAIGNAAGNVDQSADETSKASRLVWQASSPPSESDLAGFDCFERTYLALDKIVDTGTHVELSVHLQGQPADSYQTLGQLASPAVTLRAVDSAPESLAYDGSVNRIPGRNSDTLVILKDRLPDGRFSITIEVDGARNIIHMALTETGDIIFAPDDDQ